MSHTVISVDRGTTKQLDLKSEPDQVVTEADVTDTGLLRKLLTRLLSSVAKLNSEWRPRSITFRDLISTGTDVSPQSFSLTHKFGGPVEFVVVDVADTGTVALPFVARNPDSTKDVLIVDVYFEATIAIRVTEGG